MSLSTLPSRADAHRPPAALAGLPRQHRIGGLILEVQTTSLPGANGSRHVHRSATLHWGDERLELQCTPSRGGLTGRHTHRIQAAFIIGHGPAPDLIVHVGDGAYDGAFHLLYQAGGRLVSTRLCWSPRRSMHHVGVEGPDRFIHGGDALPAVIDDGRWLALGERCLYDMHTRRTAREPMLVPWADAA